MDFITPIDLEKLTANGATVQAVLPVDHLDECVHKTSLDTATRIASKNGKILGKLTYQHFKSFGDTIVFTCYNGLSTFNIKFTKFPKKEILMVGFNQFTDLTNFISNNPKSVDYVDAAKPIDNNIFIVDNSGSMSIDGKFYTLINVLENQFENDFSTDDIERRVTMCCFDRRGRYVVGKSFDNNKETVKDTLQMIKKQGANYPNTPLYKCINTVSSLIPTFEGSNVKTRVHIFTDGEDNDSTALDRYKTIKWIKNSKNNPNLMIALVCVKEDVQILKDTLNLHESNILAIENNSDGIIKFGETYKSATRSYDNRAITNQAVNTKYFVDEA